MSKEDTVLFSFILIISIQLATCFKAQIDYHQYLQRFGYAPKTEGRLFSLALSKSSYNEGIQKFQRLFKLPETGILDEQTRLFMQRPRCGNPDLGSMSRMKRDSSSSNGNDESDDFEDQMKPWRTKHLKWFIANYPKNQKKITSHEHVRRIVKQAFHDWERYSGLKFEMAETEDIADLRISFFANMHNDEFPFDGTGATLAHAFYPERGEIHFDDDEYFTDSYVESNDEYTLRLLATHEIGHALGLKHSFEIDSIMFPAYQQFNENYNISIDDQRRIQRLYGKPDVTVTTQSTQTNEGMSSSSSSSSTLSSTTVRSANRLIRKNWCAEDFQTGCEGPDGELYLFKGRNVWRYFARAKYSWDVQPKLISERFPLVEDPMINTCVKSTSGYTYLFYNDRMWRLRTHWSIDGPKVIHGRNFPKHAQVALFHKNSIYLIQNNSIYHLYEFKNDKELEIYPLDSIFHPPPSEPIQSGFTYVHSHYIFTKDLVYVYDAMNGHLLNGYPKQKTNGWFACDGTIQTMKFERKVIGPHRKMNRINHH